MIFGERFKRDGYLRVSGFLSEDLARLASDYSFLRRTFFRQIEGEPAQVPHTHSAYGDTLMETLLLHCLPKMEGLTGLKLYPTYSYYRVYEPGDELKKHRDRRSCEISASVCLGYKYVTEVPDYRWNIYVGGKAIALDPGDAVIYKGCEVEHWRDRFAVEKDSWQAQLFLHYVDAARRGAKSLIYDKRPFLGAPFELKKAGHRKTQAKDQR